MRTRIATLAALLALTLSAAPAFAITNGGGIAGGEDDHEHAYVGQLLFYVPDAPSSVYPEEPGGWFNCTGTLVEGRVVVTAGHCTFAVGLNGESTTNGGEITTAAEGGTGGNDVWINFAEEPDYEGFPPTFDEDGNLVYPTQEARYEARVEWLNEHPDWLRATADTHPQYDDLAFYLFDLGVIEIDPNEDLSSIVGDGDIAAEDHLDQYAGRRNAHRFEVVGYGLEKVLAAGAVTFGGDTRLKAEVKLNNLVSNPKDTYIQLSNNARTGGTCFGDSGGPTFDDTDSNVIVAVTSFGLSPNCTGIGGAYRIDQPDDLAFLAEHGVTP